MFVSEIYSICDAKFYTDSIPNGFNPYDSDMYLSDYVVPSSARVIVEVTGNFQVGLGNNQYHVGRDWYWALERNRILYHITYSSSPSQYEQSFTTGNKYIIDFSNTSLRVTVDGNVVLNRTDIIGADDYPHTLRLYTRTNARNNIKSITVL